MTCSMTTPPVFRQFIRSGRRGYINKLLVRALKLFERQRPVVHGRRQTKSVLDEVFFSRPVAVVHAAKLRHRLMAFVDEHQRVLRQIIEQSGRRLTRHASRQMPRVILDTVAIADFLDHLHIEQRPLMDTLRFQ